MYARTLTSRSKFIFISKVIDSCGNEIQLDSAIRIVHNSHVNQLLWGEHISTLWELIGLKGKQLIIKKYLNKYSGTNN